MQQQWMATRLMAKEKVGVGDFNPGSSRLNAECRV
jgi:hypothetical protein